ncbi:hypothetical protein NSERUTF1_2091 [Nocardia seriolae]|nr:hypothetical protein NSERUTF1_2091 [Nocardia seriolae]
MAFQGCQGRAPPAQQGSTVEGTCRTVERVRFPGHRHRPSAQLVEYRSQPSRGDRQRVVTWRSYAAYETGAGDPIGHARERLATLVRLPHAGTVLPSQVSARVHQLFAGRYVQDIRLSDTLCTVQRVPL